MHACMCMCMCVYVYVYVYVCVYMYVYVYVYVSNTFLLVPVLLNLRLCIYHVMLCSHI